MTYKKMKMISNGVVLFVIVILTYALIVVAFFVRNPLAPVNVAYTEIGNVLIFAKLDEYQRGYEPSSILNLPQPEPGSESEIVFEVVNTTKESWFSVNSKGEITFMKGKEELVMKELLNGYLKCEAQLKQVSVSEGE